MNSAAGEEEQAQANAPAALYEGPVHALSGRPPAGLE